MYKGQRQKEKQALFSRYQLRVIEDLYKCRFFQQFGNCCFKCGLRERPNPVIGSPPHLCMDHHIPMALGGHLIPGNLVSLCRTCNALKRDKDPKEFYTKEEMKRLQPLLEQQEQLFAFSFDWQKWDKSREAYLLELGIAEEVVHETLFNEHFSGYVGPTKNCMTFRISLVPE